MIRFLAISFLAILVFTGCSLKTTEGLRKVSPEKTEIENPYFSNPEIDYVYKARIALYNKTFGGILIIKKTGKESHRVVFTTEFGSKLFDFEFQGDTFTKHFILPDLDKKFIVNILRDDFDVLVSEKVEVSEQFSSENERVYKTEWGNRFGFYFFEKNAGQLQKIIKTSKTKEKVEIDFSNSEENVAGNIAIKHNNFKLKIDLEKFKEE